MDADRGVSFGSRLTAVVPIEQVRKDYFSHLTPEKLLRKVKSGDIALRVVSLEASQKSAKGVGLQALADYSGCADEGSPRRLQEAQRADRVIPPAPISGQRKSNRPA
ncbi:hypothetical protein EOC94_32430 [Mesorhizobium sp. M6A.T.Ce.TU.016.01.1.1]|nr:pyocin activator PrtN family protein [Mesorhizobium sp. M6A.T.Ce.TU.016.01.1.1]RUU25218.1 hypothetical protein EOC94_32430 [Mesorhizobium sp. M6A.T.Ce.TU.016.01.1.1]